MRYLLLLLIVALISPVSTQVLGIDFGTEYWKAALISPGKNLVIVENSRSDRKTSNSVQYLIYRLHFRKESATSNRMLDQNY
jgi:hypoxia up-regulated 1